MGDAVNFASRTEGLTKRYGVFCLVGQATMEAATDFTFRPVDLVRVKGKDEPKAIFELCGGPTSHIVEFEALDAFEQAIEAYRSGDFDKAISRFLHFADRNPHDRLAQMYLDRMEVTGEVPKDWDGVYVYKEK
jgi:adenylate cyclase